MRGRDLDRVAADAADWFDHVTQGKGNATARASHIATAVRWAEQAAARGDRPERKPRADWSQAALDAQPLKRAQARARAKHQAGIAVAKARAAAPLRPAVEREHAVDPTAPTLF